MQKLIILISFVIIFSSNVSAEFNYSSYKVKTIQSIVDNFYYNPDADYNVEAALFKYKTYVTYTGEFRSITASKKDFLLKWAFALNIPKESVDLFTTEIRIDLDDSILWLPIQDNLVKHLKSEPESLKTVMLYYMLLGSQKENLILVVNEYAVN